MKEEQEEICREARCLSALAEYQDGAVVSRTLLKKDNVLLPKLGEMIGDAAPGNTAADDDDLGLRRKINLRHMSVTF